MIWYHRSARGWDPPTTLADRVFEQLNAPNPARDIAGVFRAMIKDLIDFSRGVGTGYDEVLLLLEETGWSWDGTAGGDLPVGLRKISKFNDSLSKLMMLRRLIGMYDLNDYEADIMLREIDRQFPSQMHQPVNPSQRRRASAESFIRQHEELESGRRAQDGPAAATSRTVGRIRRQGQAGLLPPRDAGGRIQLPAGMGWSGS